MKIRTTIEKTASELIIEQMHKDKELKEIEKIKEAWDRKRHQRKELENGK